MWLWQLRQAQLPGSATRRYIELPEFVEGSKSVGQILIRNIRQDVRWLRQAQPPYFLELPELVEGSMCVGQILIRNIHQDVRWLRQAQPPYFLELPELVEGSTHNSVNPDSDNCMMWLPHDLPPLLFRAA